MRASFYIKKCRVCDSQSLKPFLDLGKQPLVNSLLKYEEDREKVYPLALVWCSKCKLVQLDYTVDPKKLFSTYVWVTNTSKAANEFSDRFCDKLISRASGDKNNYVLEIASNDGTFLKPFQKRGYQVLGIDPAENIVEMANAAGVPTRCIFWSGEAAKKLVKEKGKAKIIFARNVLAHVSNPQDFVYGISEALDDKGVVAIETHYGRKIQEELQYDSIYHEHLCYFTLKNIEKLLNSAGLFVFDVLLGPISGGALIVYARKTKNKESKEVVRWRHEEEKARVNNFSNWKNFRDNVFAHRSKLLEILGEAKKSGVVVGWGASARSSILLNFCGIDFKIISSIIDLNPLKQGKLTAGTHIKIVRPEEAFKKTPSLVFITGWNFSEEIIDSLRNKWGYRGRCLIPLPGEPRIITNNKKNEV